MSKKDENRGICCAIEARMKLEEKGIINNNQRKLKFEDLKNLMNYLDIILEKTNEDKNSVIEENNGYKICVHAELSNDFDIIVKPVLVIYGLGLILLDNNRLTREKKIEYEDDLFYLDAPLYFTGEFLLPLNLLEESMNEHAIYEGSKRYYDFDDIGKDFGVEKDLVYTILKTRGYRTYY